jgi:hypothetical protein
VSEPAITTPAAPPAFDIEKPACFYLGREYDLARGQVVPDRHVMYDARDLTTHGVVVGMTGSGKTGLCISLLEEAAIDGIPCIIIDPKGDLSNLLLQFPNLAPDDFLPWMNPEDARLNKQTPQEFAAGLSQRWRQGLTDSFQDAKRIALCRESSEWRVYTPGSEAGLAVSVLHSFKAPDANTSREALNQRIDATAGALLGLTGIEADPVQSREHILLAQLLLHSWKRGKDLDLRGLIQQVQAPPMVTIGAFDVETFYPEKERLKLAVALNNILAAPSFSTWIDGDPLDLSTMMFDGTKPRQLIFSIAHLEDAQRMFFVTLLLEEVLNWTRKQTGTTSLRAILYMDEVFGYLPPHPGNPPTKVPLMTLMKQARAFGVGVLLATQNPVDLDYKALSNAGTWFVGKLQTERDKARLLEGLEGVAAERGTLTDRNYLENVIASLKNRVFLLHNIHQPKPIVFQSRWALSFLRGPMSRDQIATLMKPLKEKLSATKKTDAPPPKLTGPAVAIPLCVKCHADLPPGTGPCPTCGAARQLSPGRIEDRAFKESLQQPVAAPALMTASSKRPELPTDVRQVFLPRRSVNPSSSDFLYQPRLLGCAEVSFVDRRRGLEHKRTYCLVAEPPPAGQLLNWVTAEAVQPLDAPEPGASWDVVPESANSAKKLKALEKSFAEYLYGNARLRLFENKKLGLVSAPQEDVQTFQNRCREAAQAEAEKAHEAERVKYLPRFNALGVPLPAFSPVKSEEKRGSILGWMLLSPFKVGAPVVNNTLAAPSKKQLDLEAEYKGKVGAIYEKWRQIGEDHGEVLLTPRKVDVSVTLFGLAWTPQGG